MEAEIIGAFETEKVNIESDLNGRVESRNL